MSLSGRPFAAARQVPWQKARSFATSRQTSWEKAQSAGKQPNLELGRMLEQSNTKCRAPHCMTLANCRELEIGLTNAAFPSSSPSDLGLTDFASAFDISSTLHQPAAITHTS